MANRNYIQQELEYIRSKNPDGLLKPEEVVEFARDPNTYLHFQFTWDNRKAAHEYRLQQARRVIEVHVKVVEPGNQPFRAYVSLQDDRQRKGGGYREVTEVLSDGEKRRQLLVQAFREFDKWRRRYEQLTELSPLFEEADRLREQVDPQKARQEEETGEKVG